LERAYQQSGSGRCTAFQVFLGESVVVWYRVRRKEEIPFVLSKIRDRFGSLRALLPVGGNDPIKLSGNYRVLVFKKGDLLIKVEGPKEVVYELQNDMMAIMGGSRPEPD
jgi:hypothetical protein